MIATHLPRPASIIGFVTNSGRYVCRDTYCVKMIAAKGEVIDRIVKSSNFDPQHCDFCKERMRYP